MAYDDMNVFAQILRGEIPAMKILETDQALAFLDVMPQSKGHALVIPKAASENLLSADPSIFGPLLAMVQQVGQAAMAAFDADGIVVQQLNHSAAGQTVFHTHFHVIPRYEGVPLKPHTGEMADADVLAECASAYKAQLG